jgi:transcriptional regulator with XRE-family HTH domain
MTLKEWRITNGLSQAALVKLLNKQKGLKVTQQHVSKWESGTEPRTRYYLAINKVTGGKVRPESFLKSS